VVDNKIAFLQENLMEEFWGGREDWRNGTTFMIKEHEVNLEVSK